jgi:hypothetical protein
MPHPFEPDEEPTKPEGFRAELRIMSERVLASEPADVAVLKMLRASAATSTKDAVRYMRACARFIDRLLG